MISREKLMILTPLPKLPNNVGNLGKIIVATGFEWLPKVQKIALSGHTDWNLSPTSYESKHRSPARWSRCFWLRPVSKKDLGLVISCIGSTNKCP